MESTPLTDSTAPDPYTHMLTAEIVQRFKCAIETGRWPDGRKLTADQVATCMEAVIRYEHQHLPKEQRSVYVPTKANTCAPGQDDAAEPVQWREP